jgi:hypothetical protein
MVYDRATSTTTRPLAEAAARRLAGTPLVLGGGSRAHLAELNRAGETLPLDLLRVVGYSVCPQVHAEDDASVMGTLAAQPSTLARARHIAGGRPVAVGPVTLRQRFNAVATGPEPAGQSPRTVDRRQGEAFTAAFTVGCLAGLGTAGSLTLYEAAGWRGLFPRDSPGGRGLPGVQSEGFPVYEVLRAVAGWVGRPVLSSGLADPRLAKLVVSHDRGPAALVANLTDVSLPITVDGGPVERLDPYQTKIFRGSSPGRP